MGVTLGSFCPSSEVEILCCHSPIVVFPKCNPKWLVETISKNYILPFVITTKSLEWQISPFTAGVMCPQKLPLKTSMIDLKHLSQFQHSANLIFLELIFHPSYLLLSYDYANWKRFFWCSFTFKVPHDVNFRPSAVMASITVHLACLLLMYSLECTLNSETRNFWLEAKLPLVLNSELFST